MYAYSPPRFFGVVSPTAAFVLGCALLAAAIVAFAAGSLVLGIVVLAAAAAVGVLFYGAAERDPTGRPAQLVLAARDRMRDAVSLAWRAASSWTLASRDVLGLRRELRTLRREREDVQRELGEAAFRDDKSAVKSIRARMQELEDGISERERSREDALERARTEVLPPDDDE